MRAPLVVGSEGGRAGRQAGAGGACPHRPSMRVARGEVNSKEFLLLTRLSCSAPPRRIEYPPPSHPIIACKRAAPTTTPSAQRPPPGRGEPVSTWTLRARWVFPVSGPPVAD